MVAVAIGAAAAVGAGTSIISGNKAANAQQKAAQLQIDESRRQSDQSRADEAPWRQLGEGALGKLAGMYGLSPQLSGPGAAQQPYGGYQQSPGYQWQLDQGVQAAQRSASARGQLGSGGTLKAITRYASGLADSDYQQYVGQLNTLAGFGQNATAGTVQAGQNASNNINNAYGNMGNAQASSYANTGSAINSGINNALSAYLFQQGGGFSGGSSGMNAYGIRGAGNIY